MRPQESPNFTLDLLFPLGHLLAETTESHITLSSFPKRAILPCEIKSREFDSKLLLACFLVKTDVPEFYRKYDK